MTRVVADLGNTRLKVAPVGSAGALLDVKAEPLRWSGWPDALARLGQIAPEAVWHISSVNPAGAAWMEESLARAGVARIVWYRSVADVPVAHRIERPEVAGADRGLAVIGALAKAEARGLAAPGIVVACGTAITVERIERDGVWTGGAIAPSLRLLGRALRLGTAQLPEIVPVGRAAEVSAWGGDTRTAIEAGVHWGLVGAVRELVRRQRESLGGEAWVIWTGGDAEWLAERIDEVSGWVVPELVLEGLVCVTDAATG